MKLYQVYYRGVAFDQSRPLPKLPDPDIAYAHNTNGEGEYLIPSGSSWVEVDRETALARNPPKSMTRQQAIAALIEKDVAKWGESEREASQKQRAKLTHGLALNALAYYDIDAVDSALAAQAKSVMTQTDRAALRSAK